MRIFARILGVAAIGAMLHSQPTSAQSDSLFKGLQKGLDILQQAPKPGVPDNNLADQVRRDDERIRKEEEERARKEDERQKAANERQRVEAQRQAEADRKREEEEKQAERAERAAREKAAKENAVRQQEQQQRDARERQERERQQATARVEQEKAAKESSTRKEKEFAERVAMAETEAKEKGAEYAKSSGTKWTLHQKKDEMTGKSDTKVFSHQKNSGGATGEVVGECDESGFSFLVTIVDGNGRQTIGFPEKRRDGGVVGRFRENDAEVRAAKFESIKGSNRFMLVWIPNQKGLSEIKQSFGLENEALEKLLASAGSVAIFRGEKTLWRLLTEIETSVGPLTIKIPTFDPAIRKALDECKGF